MVPFVATSWFCLIPRCLAIRKDQWLIQLVFVFELAVLCVHVFSLSKATCCHHRQARTTSFRSIRSWSTWVLTTLVIVHYKHLIASFCKQSTPGAWVALYTSIVWTAAYYLAETYLSIPYYYTFQAYGYLSNPGVFSHETEDIWRNFDPSVTIVLSF